MSENQAPGLGPEGNQTSATLELLRLRGAISDIAINEGRLKIQEGQLQVWVARYRGEAQDSLDAALAARAQQQLAILQPQLANVREQLARLQQEKAALTQQQQAILEKLNISSPDQARTLTSDDSGIAWSPPPPIKLPSRHRRLGSRPLFWLSALLAALVIVLAVLRVNQSFFSPAPQPTVVAQAPTPTPTPPPPPIFTPTEPAQPIWLVWM